MKKSLSKRRNNESREFDILRLASNPVHLLNKVNIDPQNMEKESETRKLIIRDVLNTIGACLESIYGDKRFNIDNSVHRDVMDNFLRFLEKKIGV